LQLGTYFVRASPLLALLALVAAFTGVMLPQHAFIFWCAANVIGFSLAVLGIGKQQEFWSMSRATNPGCFWVIIACFSTLVLLCLGLTYFLIANW